MWSLGVVLFSLLVGSTPFDIANESDDAFLRFREEGFGVIEEMRADAPVSAQALSRCSLENSWVDVLKCTLVENPNNRIRLEELQFHPFLH